MKPITRKEQFIQAAADGTTPPKPLTREELILSGAGVTPLTREEYFAEKMSMGGSSTYAVTIDNKTGEGNPAEISVATAGIEGDEMSFADSSFSVTCEIACVVAWTDDDGETYHRLYGTAAGEDTYSFTLPKNARKGGVTVVVALKGDGDFSGEVDADDIDIIDQSTYPSSDPLHIDLTKLQIIVLDLDKNGKVDLADEEILNNSLLSPRDPKYAPLEWDVITEGE